MSEKPEFVDIEQGRAALKEVRADGNDTDWALFSYDNSKPQKIILVGKGNGGVEELKQQLQDNSVGYGLIRKTDKIDDSITVKFCFITWIPENIPRMLRARLGVHSGAIKEFIGQFHVDLTISHLSELSDDILQEKIMDTSGSGSRVVDASTGASHLKSQSQGNSGQRLSINASKGTGELQFGNEAELKDAIKEVRLGNVEWVLFGYEGGNSSTIVLLGQGNGGVAELVGHLKDDIVAYGLVRKVEQIDDTQATKFAFIKFQGENIPRMLRARLGTHMGKITEFFSPHHVALDVTHTNELSDEIVLRKIKNASGTSVHVLADEHTQKSVPIAKGTTGPAVAKPSSTPSKAPVVPKNLSQEQGLKFVDEEGLRADIKDVRNDNSPTNWALVGYEGKKGNTLVSLGKGDGGIEELVSLLEDDMVGYGLVRKTEKIDETLAVKFVHVVFVGENINRMHRARLGTHKGAINSIFAPYHVDVEATVKSELTDEILMKKIQDASGTGSKVKA